MSIEQAILTGLTSERINRRISAIRLDRQLEGSRLISTARDKTFWSSINNVHYCGQDSSCWRWLRDPVCFEPRRVYPVSVTTLLVKISDQHHRNIADRYWWLLPILFRPWIVFIARSSNIKNRRGERGLLASILSLFWTSFLSLSPLYRANIKWLKANEAVLSPIYSICQFRFSTKQILSHSSPLE